MDVHMDDEHYYVVIDIPGTNPEEVEVTSEPPYSLIVSGVRRLLDYGDLIWAERRGFRFYRKITFPTDISEAKLSLDYRDGVLILALSK
jgi:HSP20 family molecular chaperone IbpA